MKRKLCALLVGINAYAGKVPPLKGCSNDVENVENHLATYFNHYDLEIETLTDCRATRDSIIAWFRGLPGKAGHNDLVLFYFSGHGSRVLAPGAFSDYEPDRRHETLVCYDSRTGNGWDLADKELAVLFSEAAAAKPHILAILDCCHSGSGIREVNEFDPETVKYAPENSNTRPLESYLHGYFIKHGPRVPRCKMALMAACDKNEKAREDPRIHEGIFTHNLLKILKESGNNISYKDLSLRTRTAVFNHAGYQTPQLECLERFNAYSIFLDGKIHPDSHRHRIYYKGDAWFINGGADLGVPDDPGKEIKIVIYDSQKSTAQGISSAPFTPSGIAAGGNKEDYLPAKSGTEIEIYGRTLYVGLQESKIEVVPNDLLEIAKEYRGDFVSLPITPLHVYLSGDEEGMAQIKQVFDREYASRINFLRQPFLAQYEVRCADGCYRLRDRVAHRVISAVGNYTEENALNLLSRLARIERWQRTLNLQNSKTGLNPLEVEFIFRTKSEKGKDVECAEAAITLDYREYQQQGGGIPYELKLKNRFYEKLFFTLLYLSPDFGIYSLRPCEYISRCEKGMVLDDRHELNIPDETYNEVFDTFILIVSTGKLEEYLFEQTDIGKEENFRNIQEKDTRRRVPGDWFCRSITVKTKR